MGQINKIPYSFERLAIQMQPQTKENSCSTYHSFNVLFSITIYNFLTTVRKLWLASNCLPSLLHFYFTFTHYIRSLTETMSRKFREISRIQQEQIWQLWTRSFLLLLFLLLLLLLFFFLRFQYGSINLPHKLTTSETVWFLIS